MRLAILGSRGYPSTYSGYETLVRHLVPHFVERGHAVTVYCRDETAADNAAPMAGVRRITTRGWNTKSLSTPSHGLTSSLDAMFRRFDAALVVNIANGFWLPLLRAARLPTAVNTDGLEWERGKWNRLAQGVFRLGASFTAAHANELVADSTVIGEIWREEFGRDSTFIPYGAPVVTDAGRDELGAVGLGDQPFLLSVARLVPENNVDLTLDALELLGDSAPLGVIAGSGVGSVPLESRLEAMSARGRVLWLGHVDDQRLLTQLWANCSVYVHGHSVGGTNPSLLQALGAGAPTIALGTPFNAEVLRNDAQLYEPSPEHLARRIWEVVDDPELRAELAGRGRGEVAERYSWTDVCGRYLELLERLAAAR